MPPLFKGVATNPPPSQFMASVHHELANAMAQIPSGKHTTLVFDIDTKAGVNLAIVSDLGTDHWQVEMWVGKTWDEPIVGGAKLKASW